MQKLKKSLSQLFETARDFGLKLRHYFNASELVPQARRGDTSQSTKVIRYISVSVAILFIWAAFSEIEQSTRATGQVIPISRSQIVQSFDGGVLRELLVKEGQAIEKDQVLAKLDKTRFESSYLETRAKVAALSGMVSRLKSEVYGDKLKFDPILDDYPDFIRNQKILYEKRKKAIGDELKALRTQESLMSTELNMTEPLLKTGDVSKVEVIRLQRQLNDIQAQVANKSNKYFQDAHAELNKSEEELTSFQEMLTQKKEQLDRVELKSPMAGIVKNIRITTLGGVIKPGEEVLQVVPDGDDLMIETKVRPADIAFLKPGLPAIVKIDAYDSSIYGSLDGKVTFISPDTLTEDNKNAEQNYYRVQIQTQGKNFSGKPNQALEIQPGMTATVDIITGKNTVLKYLLKPVIKTVQGSLTER